MDAKVLKVMTKLLADRLTNRPTKFINEPTHENPVYVMNCIEQALTDLESYSRQDNFREACEALSRGCTWKDYDGKKWSK